MKRPAFDTQPDLFVDFHSDLALRDQREVMERPFFSLSKKKRIKPIEYVSPDKEIFVKVSPVPEYGMATIWDADILIWATSVMRKLKDNKINDVPRTLRFYPYDLLKSIHRHTGGDEYMNLRRALSRLQSTTITTNIRAGRSNKHRQFSWIESFTDDIDPDKRISHGMSITLSDWLYEGIMADNGVLAINPLYFTITGGRERWLYRVARKHAGGAGPSGFAMSFSTLFAKSGAEGNFRRFKFELLKIARENALPDYALEILNPDSPDPGLRMVRMDGKTDGSIVLPPQAPAKTAKPSPQISDAMREKIRAAHPGWDLHALQRDYDAWLESSTIEPDNYEKLFYSFVQRAVTA
jgi:plasmid replication initiation protein